MFSETIYNDVNENKNQIKNEILLKNKEIKKEN